MQNLINDTPAPVKRNYDFIDTIRCIAMIFIVSEHSIFFESDQFHPTGFKALFYIATIQISKFGTICFFILAGFLIGDKFVDYTPFQYLKRRINNTIWPWLFWSLLYVVEPNIDSLISNHSLVPGFTGGGSYWPVLWRRFSDTYLLTIYWFIPNFLFCITLLLVFKRYLYKYMFGGALLTFVIFYTINIYFGWITPGHTTAILGFVFFLWLGAIFNKNWYKMSLWIDRTSLWMWWGLTVLTLFIGIAEISYLKYLQINDPYNSLRISNILFSMSCFFLLLKIRDFKLIGYLKPRETTFGIYLIHYFFVVFLLPRVFDRFGIKVDNLSVMVMFLYQILRFSIVYFLTLGVVMLINKSKFKWLIGR